MISLLAKFPWYSVNNYTIATRNQIFNATRSMLHILSINLNKNYNAVRNLSGDVIGSGSDYSTPVRRQGNGVVSSALLTEDLMKDLLMAGLNAAGFSEKQRWELYETSDYVRHRFAMSPLMQWWPFEVLCRKPRIEEDVVQVSNPHPLPSIQGTQLANCWRIDSSMPT